MRLARVRQILAKDLRVGPRSPLLLWALVLPVLLTLLVRGVFGGLFDPSPQLGVLDRGDSALVAEALALDGIEVTVVQDATALREAVAAGDLDAGLVLPAGFDASVRAGDRPALDLFVGGESLASDRILIAVTTLDLVRGVAGATPPVTVEVVTVGDPGVPLELRMLPLIVVMAVAIAGAMLPAAGLVEEKEKGTLDAILVTPLRMGEVLLAKGLLGWILAVSAGAITLGVNGVLPTAPVALLAGIALGGVMMAQVGLLLGCWAPDTNTLFAAWKGGALVLVFPVLFFLWPELPEWPARLGPTYYFLRPVFAISVEGAGLVDVWPDLVGAALICAALLPAVAATGRWLEAHRVGGRTARRPAPVRPR